MSYHERPLTQVKCNREGDLLLTCSKDGQCCLIRTATGERIGTYELKEIAGSKPPAVFALDITADSKLVCTASADGSLGLFYAMTGEQIVCVNTGGITKFCEFNREPLAQNRIVVACDKFKDSPAKLVVYRINEKAGKLSEDLVINHTDGFPMKANKVSWGPYDTTLISIHPEGQFCVWDVKDGSLIKTVSAHLSEITGMQMSPNQDLMVTSSKDQTVKLWSLHDYEEIKKYRADRPLNDAAISPLYLESEQKAKYHIICGGGQEARDVTTTAAAEGRFEAVLFHMVFEEELATIKGHFGPINTLAVFPQGNGFATGGEDGNVRINVFDNEYFNNKRLD